MSPQRLKITGSRVSILLLRTFSLTQADRNFIHLQQAVKLQPCGMRLSYKESDNVLKDDSLHFIELSLFFKLPYRNNKFHY
jgi:hypothetical protein